MSCRLRRVPTQAPLAPNENSPAVFCPAILIRAFRRWSSLVSGKSSEANGYAAMLPYFFFATDTLLATFVHVESGLKESMPLASSAVFSPRSF